MHTKVGTQMTQQLSSEVRNPQGAQILTSEVESFLKSD